MRTCSGTSSRSRSGTQRATPRSVRSSTSSRRTGVGATMSTPAMIRSTSPRMSAAFQLDCRAPSRVSTRSTTASRLTRPIAVPACVTAAAGGVKPELARVPRSTGAAVRRRPSVRPCRVGPVPRRGGPRNAAVAGPGSWPGCSLRHFGLVAVEVAADLRGAGAERTGVRRELDDLAGLGVEGVAVRGERPRGTRGRSRRRRARSR